MNIIDITKYYRGKNDVFVLDHITYEFSNQKINIILGPSGCGKSTLLNIISGLDKAFIGEISINTNTKIGYMFQTPSLIPWRNVWDNVLLSRELHGDKSENSKKIAKQLLNNYSLTAFSNTYPNSLSQGMQQRVSLIRLLLYGANLLLMDEPFSRIDFFTKRKLYKDINNLIINENLTIILVTHDVEEAVLLGDKVIILSDRPAKIVCEIDIPINREDRDVNAPGIPDNLQPYLRKVWDNLDLSKMTKDIKIK